MKLSEDVKAILANPNTDLDIKIGLEVAYSKEQLKLTDTQTLQIAAFFQDAARKGKEAISKVLEEAGFKNLVPNNEYGPGIYEKERGSAEWNELKPVVQA